jgi:hypothetical protein
MNVQLLIATRDWILKEPSMVNMREGICRLTNAKDNFSHVGEPECGTTACIAGTGLMIHLRVIGMGFEEVEKELENVFWRGGVDSRAIEALGITYDESQVLFYESKWPDAFYLRLQKEKPGTLAYAQVVADRINSFIDTNGEG